MANFTRVSESGQIEIDWNMLQAESNMSYENVQNLMTKVNAYLESKYDEYEIVHIEDFDSLLSVRLQSESYSGGELTFGSYVTIICDKMSGSIVKNHMTHYDMLKFGYQKVKGVK